MSFFLYVHCRLMKHLIHTAKNKNSMQEKAEMLENVFTATSFSQTKHLRYLLKKNLPVPSYYIRYTILILIKYV